MQNTVLKVVEEFGGALTLLSAITLNLVEILSKSSVNGWFVLFTSIGGLVYLCYKIITQRKESKLKDLEIERELLEIERLKKNN